MVNFQVFCFGFFLFSELCPSLLDHQFQVFFGDLFWKPPQNDCVITRRVHNVIAFLLDFTEVITEEMEQKDVDHDECKHNVILNRQQIRVVHFVGE